MPATLPQTLASLNYFYECGQ